VLIGARCERHADDCPFFQTPGGRRMTIGLIAALVVWLFGAGFVLYS
jgi:hypothetical protein